MPDSGPKSFLDQISTRWACVNDPAQFVLRYAPAIRNYMGALIKNQHDAEEAAQDFLLRAVKQGFHSASPDRGRFRDYLKAAVRNAAFKHLQRRHAIPLGDALAVVLDHAVQRADQDWNSDWQRCLLQRVWRALERHQSDNPANLCHTVLRLAVDYPEEDSNVLAGRAAALSGRPLRADAFRKQLSRARRLFAEFLLDEITQTVEAPTADRIEEELTELGLMAYVRDYLPDDWRPPTSSGSQSR